MPMTESQVLFVNTDFNLQDFKVVSPTIEIIWLYAGVDMSLKQKINDYLSTINDPNINLPIAKVARIEWLECSEQLIKLNIILPYASSSFGNGLKTLLIAGISGLLEAEKLELEISFEILPFVSADRPEAIQQVKHIIAIASGKGGVGKSTTTVNLALALVKEGAKVGILDADIYGPSQAKMLGVKDGARPETESEKWMFPIEAHGVKSMSIAYLVDADQPMVWRGPMVSSALQQMLFQTKWGELDYLFVDMPPGTGDIHLTFSQQVPASGALIVTTPQDIALLDAVKGIEMFRKVNIPVLGVIENMAMHVCSNCGHEEAIFGENGGSKIAEQYQSRLLGSMPLERSIREQLDAGKPTVLDDSDSLVAVRYQQLALALAAEIGINNKQNSVVPEITISEE